MKTISGVNVCRLKESFWKKFCLGAHAMLLNEKESQTNREIWWCRDGVNDSVSEKCKIWKDSEQGKKNK